MNVLDPNSSLNFFVYVSILYVSYILSLINQLPKASRTACIEYFINQAQIAPLLHCSALISNNQ